MTEIIKLDDPYWYHPDGLAGLDFNREIRHPGENENYPDGVVAIRVDDFFWVVAALPYAEYIDWTVEQIVKKFWPEYYDQATFLPDEGTHEQTVYRLKTQIESLKRYDEHSTKKIEMLREENERLKRGCDLTPRRPSRVEHMNNYFVRQYELLLAATAHKAVAYSDPSRAGVCSVCNLLLSDRVHMDKWIKKRGSHDHSLMLAFQVEDM